MSITVSALLNLPSLRQAQVEAGHSGLSRIVSSVSVLEYADPAVLEDDLFHNDEFCGSEIVITGFVNNPTDEALQCAVVKRLAEAGEVGLILYYVGCFMPEIPQKMKQIAEDYNFVLIVMPRNRMDFRYSEAICEIMEAVVKDRFKNPAFVGELLEQVSRLPQNRRNVGTMLKMLSGRLMASLFLTSHTLEVLNEACWPLSLRETLNRFLAEGDLPEADKEEVVSVDGSSYYLYRFPIRSDTGRPMELFLFKEGEAVAHSVLEQAAEAVSLAVSIWSSEHDAVAVTELVRAILQDEPVKMRRLAGLFHIDVAAIHTMFIIRCVPGQEEGKAAPVLKELSRILHCFNKNVAAASYDGQLVLFVDGPKSLSEEQEMGKAVKEYLDSCPFSCTVTCCNHLDDTSNVREAFLMHQDFIEDVRILFPQKEIYHLQELRFAKACRQMAAGGERSVEDMRKPLERIKKAKEGTDYIKTLQVYLLDAQCSYQRTGELLYLHKNTVKYRISQCSDLLGYRIGEYPDTLSLYYAAAMERLLDGK